MVALITIVGFGLFGMAWLIVEDYFRYWGIKSMKLKRRFFYE
jgi:hypothetical protein